MPGSGNGATNPLAPYLIGPYGPYGSLPPYQLTPRALQEVSPGERPEQPPREPPAEEPAHVEVKVPATAQLWFGQTLTRKTGPVREFVTPPLKRGQDFLYDVRARWMQDGREVEQTRRITVSAGARVPVDFTRPAKP
jgi:uncharacterized protein (TIGR03000 family)